MEGYYSSKTGRATIGFTSGELRKSKEVNKDIQVKELWYETFQNEYSNAEKERGSLKESYNGK